VFEYLRAWILALESLCERTLPREMTGDSLDPLERHAVQVISRATDLHPEPLLSALHSTGALQITEHVVRHAAHENLRRSLHEAFDGFRTLKLVHALRDAGLPNLPLDEALQSAPFIPLPATTRSDTAVRSPEVSEARAEVHADSLRKLDYEGAP
jgi:hypothetical protein